MQLPGHCPLPPASMAGKERCPKRGRKKQVSQLAVAIGRDDARRETRELGLVVAILRCTPVALVVIACGGLFGG